MTGTPRPAVRTGTGHQLGQCDQFSDW
jgi:hypothetical protein